MSFTICHCGGEKYGKLALAASHSKLQTFSNLYWGGDMRSKTTQDVAIVNYFTISNTRSYAIYSFHYTV